MRLKKEIDLEILHKLCESFATREDVCYILDISANTLNKRIGELYPGKTYRDLHNVCLARAKIAIRQKQFQQAMEGDTALLKWLGINMLGQSDKPKSESPGISRALSDAFEIGIMEKKDRGPEKQ